MSKTISIPPKANDQQNQQELPILQEAIVWRERQRFMLITGFMTAFLLVLATISALILINQWIKAQRQMVTTMSLSTQNYTTPSPTVVMETEPSSRTLPSSVRKYLTALEEVERRRQALLGSYHLPAKGLDDFQERVERLQKQISSLTPPPECSGLHQDYEQVLKTHLAVIAQAKRGWFYETSGTLRLSRGERLQIDTALRAADSTLEVICRRYGVPKPFSIRQVENNRSENLDP